MKGKTGKILIEDIEPSGNNDIKFSMTFQLKGISLSKKHLLSILSTLLCRLEITPDDIIVFRKVYGVNEYSVDRTAAMEAAGEK